MANDHDKGTAVFPAGLTLRIENDGVVLGNRGDVVIAGDLGASLGTIKHAFADGGSVTVQAPEFSAQYIEARGGEVILEGNVKARRIKADAVRQRSGKLTSQVIVAGREIELAGDSIKADVVVAPAVHFSPEIKGRVVAVQCDNEMGPSKVRGRLSLADYVDIVADARETLQANDIAVPEGDEDDDEDEPEELATAPPTADAGASDVAELPPDSSLQPGVEEDLDADMAAISRSLTPPAAADLPSGEMRVGQTPPRGVPGLTEAEVADLGGQLDTALGTIVEAYDDGEVPPPVVFLQSLIEERRLYHVKLQINSIWSDLLKYHQTKGLYMTNAVTHHFQQIQMAMRKVPQA